jgi:hypothetical protein
MAKSPKRPSNLPVLVQADKPNPLPVTVAECDTKLRSMVLKRRQARLRNDERQERVCTITIDATLQIRSDLAPIEKREAA